MLLEPGGTTYDPVLVMVIVGGAVLLIALVTATCLATFVVLPRKRELKRKKEGNIIIQFAME